MTKKEAKRVCYRWMLLALYRAGRPAAWSKEPNADQQRLREAWRQIRRDVARQAMAPQAETTDAYPSPTEVERQLRLPLGDIAN